MTEHDPLYHADTEAIQMLLRPLFIASFLIDDQLADTGSAARGPVVISSASSKTAMGVALLLAHLDGVEGIGLTSARSATFVDGLDILDRTITYDAIDSLPPGPATFVDVAGDSGIRRAVHTRYGDDLLQSMVVGATYWARPGGRGAPRIHSRKDALTGPSPVFFFAPDRIVQRSRDWGPAGLQARMAGAWHEFCAWTTSWLEVDHRHGFDAVQSGYLEVLSVLGVPCGCG